MIVFLETEMKSFWVKTFFLYGGKDCSKIQFFNGVALWHCHCQWVSLIFFKEEDSRSLAKKCIEIEIKVNLGFKEP